MFTSRAEHRLLLNHASAELRLLAVAEDNNLVSGKRMSNIKSKKQVIESWIRRLEVEKTTGGTFADRIRRIPLDDFSVYPQEFFELNGALRDEIDYKIRYKGYLEREERVLEKMVHLDKIKIPLDFSFSNIRGLRNESIEKLIKIKPITLGQASRISGITPSDISLIMIMLGK
jgi:tRNA uridine 5-carboxymethylaminomethyl modification enzyme